MSNNILYISYDGMTDPLGQSQVLPYLVGLSHQGYFITLISFEKKEKYFSDRRVIEELIKDNKINWIPLFYTKNPPVLSTLWDLNKMYRKAKLICEQRKVKIVHCRSYITSLVGAKLKSKLGVKFIFDMRGFWADERVEGEIWNLKNPVFKLIYSYFKKKELQFLSGADCVISLTECGKKEIYSWNYLKKKPWIEVIPCCVDQELFTPGNPDPFLMKKIGISEKDLVVSYLGSIGTWYLLDEMLLFFKELLKIKQNAKFLFITQDKEEIILNAMKSNEIDKSKIIIIKAKRREVPELLRLSHIALFFIKPLFSKKASSPTKQAEVLSVGLPIVCNSNIGDTDDLVDKNKIGIVVKDFSPHAFREAVMKIDSILQLPKKVMENVVEEKFSLERGIETYKKIYENLCK